MGTANAARIRRARQCLRAMVLAASLLCDPPRSAHGQPGAQQARVKAIYMRKILSFVQWPDEAFSGKDKTFRFCVDGDHLFGFAVAEEMKDITIGGRNVEVQWAPKDRDLKACQALFVAAADAKHIAKVLENVKGATVLTFGETEGFLDAGGIVQLSSEDSVIRFQINLAAARIAGLRVDARLLGLAKRVV